MKRWVICQDGYYLVNPSYWTASIVQAQTFDKRQAEEIANATRMSARSGHLGYLAEVKEVER